MNFRGSTGYGKTFLHKGDKQWGVGDMQHDLTDAVNWAIEQSIADKHNICIYGGSYGGYACLAGELNSSNFRFANALLFVCSDNKFHHLFRIDIHP